MVTRIAPTPSGFLHAGNHYNFQTTADLAREYAIPLALRIDDVDAARFRSVYVDDIFNMCTLFPRIANHERNIGKLIFTKVHL